MPQKKERRRIIAFWLTMSKPIFLVTVGMIIITASSLLLLSKKQNSVIGEKKTPASLQSDKINTNTISKHSQDSKSYTSTDNNELDKNEVNNIPIAAVSSNTDIAYTNNKRLIALQTDGQSKNYNTDDRFDPFIQSSLLFVNPKLDPASVNLISGKTDLSFSKELDNRRSSLDVRSEDLANNSKKNGNNNNEKGFYAGIMSGVDLSSINFRSSKTGSTKGFILGYTINNKWSIESGLFWDTKRFSDNGQHFDPPGYTPSSVMTITAVNGKNRLYEVPVNVKYSITSGKHNLFATTGLSSYFMRSENYDYEYTQNNQPAGHNYLNYTNQSKNWVSVVNLSVGYTHKFGATGSLRVEPYLKLPLKDLGVGNIPITSTGLNIGFIKTIR